MYDLTYHRADSVDDALVKKSSSDDGKFLSGGMTLLATMKARLAAPTDLIDLAHIADMKGIKVSGKTVRIGALTTHYEVSTDKSLSKACISLSSLASHIGDAAVRHCGTIGGSLANNDPAADYPAAMLALNATIITNTGSHSADDFFTGLFETALGEDEIIVAVEFTVPKRGYYSKFPNPASRYAMAGVFVAETKDGVRVGVTGAGSDGVYRATDMESALSSNWSSKSLESCVQDESKMLGDIHATKAYRAHLVQVMASRAVDSAS